MSYAEGKAKAIEEAMNWQRSFTEGRSYTWAEVFEYTSHFTKLAKRYGLVREFRENGII
jgi:hypothetical protein